jgi:hypothetical protein
MDPAQAAAETAEFTADWFLMVRCPEMSVETGDADGGRQRLTEWIQAAREAGFQPLAFTDALERLSQGERLPDRSIVLMFDPAYRKTVEQILPVLESLRVPALWVTRSPGRIRADRRFVSAHERRSFSAQPFWDFAVHDEVRQFELEKVSAGRTLPRVYEWQSQLGVNGVNRGTNLTRLNRLHANASWSAEEFVDRLTADLPLYERGILGVREIDERLWGIVLPATMEEAFDLRAPRDRRFSSVRWEGTRGLQDLKLSATIESWVGEAWLHLRSDRERGDRIRVGFMEGTLRVLQETGGLVVEDRRETWPIQPDQGLCLELVLSGETLQIQSSTASARADFELLVPGSRDGLVEFSVYHRIHGAAAAESLHLIAAPVQGLDRAPTGEILVDASDILTQDDSIAAGN